MLFDRQQKKKRTMSDQPGGSTSQTPTQMTTTVGQLDNFDPHKEHWECYFERFEQFIVINNIARQSDKWHVYSQ